MSWEGKPVKWDKPCGVSYSDREGICSWCLWNKDQHSFLGWEWIPAEPPDGWPDLTSIKPKG